MHRRIITLILMWSLAVAGTAAAQTAEWRYGGRLLHLNTDALSGELGDTGYHFDVASSLGLEFDATVMFSNAFAAEFSIGGAAPRLKAVDGDCCPTIDAGRLWLAPLTATAQFHLQVYGPWDPYVGLGITWIVPFYSLSDDLRDAGLSDVDFEGNLGLAAQVGFNYQMDNRWYVNLDLKYLGASLEARAKTDEEDIPTVNLDINPFVIGLGFGYKF
jgi:outer membrane protein